MTSNTLELKEFKRNSTLGEWKATELLFELVHLGKMVEITSKFLVYTPRQLKRFKEDRNFLEINIETITISQGPPNGIDESELKLAEKHSSNCCIIL